jgi:hypothetical protein
MLGLVIGFLTYFSVPHRKVVSNDQVELLVRPVFARTIRHGKEMNEMEAVVQA